MGLIKCPDCEKMFSDRIKACPECGCPIEEAIKENNSLQYGPYVEVMEPASLRNRLRENILKMCDKYRKGENKND